MHHENSPYYLRLKHNPQEQYVCHLLLHDLHNFFFFPFHKVVSCFIKHWISWALAHLRSNCLEKINQTEGSCVSNVLNEYTLLTLRIKKNEKIERVVSQWHRFIEVLTQRESWTMKTIQEWSHFEIEWPLYPTSVNHGYRFPRRLSLPPKPLSSGQGSSHRNEANITGDGGWVLALSKGDLDKYQRFMPNTASDM